MIPLPCCCGCRQHPSTAAGDNSSPLCATHLTLSMRRHWWRQGRQTASCFTCSGSCWQTGAGLRVPVDPAKVPARCGAAGAVRRAQVLGAPASGSPRAEASSLVRFCCRAQGEEGGGAAGAGCVRRRLPLQLERLAGERPAPKHGQLQSPAAATLGREPRHGAAGIPACVKCAVPLRCCSVAHAHPSPSHPPAPLPAPPGTPLRAGAAVGVRRHGCGGAAQPARPLCPHLLSGLRLRGQPPQR